MTRDALLRISCNIDGAKQLWQHVLLLNDSWVWVDAGIASTPDDFLFPYLEQEALTPPQRQLCLVTHADVDHFGGLHAMRGRFPGLVVLAHAADADWIENRARLMAERYALHKREGIAPPPERVAQLKSRGGGPASVDVRLAGGEKIGDGETTWEVLHLPGHSPGHLGLWEPSSGRAIIGDAALGWGVPDRDGRPTSAPPYYDLDAYLASIAALEKLALDDLHTSHFPPLHGNQVADFLDASRHAAQSIGEATRRALQAMPEPSLLDLCRTVAADIGRWPEQAAVSLADPISAHLDAWHTAGELAISRSGGTTLYSID